MMRTSRGRKEMAALALALLLWPVPGGAGTEAYNPLNGSVREEADLVINPAKMDFGDTDMSISASVGRSVTIRNATRHVIELAIAPLPDPVLSMTHSCPDQLEPGQTCAVSVIWAPKQAGKLESNLTVQAGPLSRILTIVGSARGHFSTQPRSGAGSAILSVGDDKIDLSDSPAGATAVTILSNAGDRPVTIRKIVTGTAEDKLLLSGSCLEQKEALAPGESCSLHVTSMGVFVRTALVIHHDGLRGVASVPVVIKPSVNSQQPASAMGVADNGGGTPQKAAALAESTIAPSSPGRPMTEPAPSRPSSGQGREIVSLDGLAGKTALISLNGRSLPVSHGARIHFAGSQWQVSVSPDGIVLAAPGRADVRLTLDERTHDPSGSESPARGRSGGGANLEMRMKALDRLIEGEP